MEISAWLLFYAGFLFLTLLTAIISNFKNRLIPFAYIAIIISFALPLINFVFTIGKPADITGTSYLIQEFQDRNLWAVLIVFMFFYLLAWMGLFIYVLFGKSFIKWYSYIVEKGKDLWVWVSRKIKESKKQNSVNKERKTRGK